MRGAGRGRGLCGARPGSVPRSWARGGGRGGEGAGRRAAAPRGPGRRLPLGRGLGPDPPQPPAPLRPRAARPDAGRLPGHRSESCAAVAAGEGAPRGRPGNFPAAPPQPPAPEAPAPPERPPLAPAAVPEDGWPRVSLDPPGPRRPSSPGGLPISVRRILLASSEIPLHPAPRQPRSWDGRGAEPALRPGRNTCSGPCSWARGAGRGCRLLRADRGGENGAPRFGETRPHVGHPHVSQPSRAIMPESWGLGSCEGQRAASLGMELLALSSRPPGSWGKTCLGSLPCVRPRLQSAPILASGGGREVTGAPATPPPPPHEGPGTRDGPNVGGARDPHLRAPRMAAADVTRAAGAASPPPSPSRPPSQSWPRARPGKALFCQREPSECAEKSLPALMRVHAARRRGG